MLTLFQHCSISAPVVCTPKYIRDYFQHGSLPDEGTVCQVIGELFPEKPATGLVVQTGDNDHPSVARYGINDEDIELYDAVLELNRAQVVQPMLGGSALVKRRLYV